MVDTVHRKIFEGEILVNHCPNDVETFGESPGRPSVISQYIAILIDKAKIIVKCAKIFPCTVT